MLSGFNNSCGTIVGQFYIVGQSDTNEIPMGFIWTIIIGFVAGIIAKFLMPGENEPSGFILTTLLGVVGAFVATYLGQAVGWYQANEGAGLIGAVVGAIIVLAIWGFVARNRRHAGNNHLRWRQHRHVHRIKAVGRGRCFCPAMN